MKTIALGDHSIGDGHPCFIIAEAGVAHFGSFEIAKALVDVAVEAHASAVKFQVFRTDRLVSSASEEWVRRLRPKELSFEAFAELKQYCESTGMMFLATPHEEYSADFLADLGVPAFKVGSGEVNNSPFITHLARKGKPLVISTGLHDDAAIRALLRVCNDAGCHQVALLHCVTAYPTPPEQSNLRSIPWMRAQYGVPTGYSDHTIGYEIPLAAVALGASIIEKHICLDKRIAGSQDCRVSCDRDDLVAMVAAIRRIEAALGSDGKSVAPAAQPAILWARKSLVAKRALPSGHRLTADDVVSKRPGTGIPPDEQGKALGRRLLRPLNQDDVISWSDLAGDEDA